MFEDLEQDYQKSKNDVQQNIDTVTQDIHNRMDEYKQTADEMYNKTKAAVSDHLAKGKESVTAAAQYTDKKVRENPWYAVGAAAVIGVILGVVVASGKNKK